MGRSRRFLCAALAVFAATWLWIAVTGPERMAMHTSSSGEVDRWGSRWEFLTFSGLFALATAALLLGIALLAGRVPRSFINTPKPSLWMSDEHRPEFNGLLRDLMARIAALVLLLLAAINAAAALELTDGAFLVPVTIGFLALILIDCLRYCLRLDRGPSLSEG